MSLDGAISRLDRLLVLLTAALIAAAAVIAAVSPAATTATPPAATGTSTQGTSSGAPSPGLRPLQLQIPSIDVDADIVLIDVNDEGVLNPPDDLSIVGWWRKSARAGATEGQTVITGHSAAQVEGVLDNLPEAQNGARVIIKTAKRGTVEYVVTGQVELNHKQLADQAVELFGQDRDVNRLVLVTCSDYRNGVWNKNTIVFAQPI